MCPKAVFKASVPQSCAGKLSKAAPQSCSPKLFPEAAPQSCCPKLLPQSCSSSNLPKRFPAAASQSCSPKHGRKAVFPKLLCFKPVPQSSSPKLFSKAAPESCPAKLLPKAAPQSCVLKITRRRLARERKDVFQAALRMVVVKDSRWIVGEFYMSYGKIWCEKVRLIKERIFGKGHQMTCVLQPQRERGAEIKRERERERERKKARERENERGGVERKHGEM